MTSGNTESENGMEYRLAVKSYKCFGGSPQSLAGMKLINVVIGRNNSGKSSILEVIKYLIDYYNENTRRIDPRNGYTEIIETVTADAEIAQALMGRSSSLLIGKEIQWSIPTDGSRGRRLVSVQEHPITTDVANQVQNNIERLLSPWQGVTYHAVKAERDIVPEIDQGEFEVNDEYLDHLSSGKGLTNLIQAFVNKNYLDRSVVEESFLEALNSVAGDDASFKRILCQQLPNKHWEIYFDESEKGLVPLSSSGSGFKTIILALANFVLVPEIVLHCRRLQDPSLSDSRHDYLSKAIFAFEELENNLHPAMLRRLLEYMTCKASENSSKLIITTHSATVIDYFSRKGNSQTVHLRHNGQEAVIETIASFADQVSILDELGIRASDLFQSNGVIWVEGPSDRYYLLRWLELWSEGTTLNLIEGVHFSILFYGGKLLSHLSALPNEADTDEIENKVQILAANRNAIIMIDRDSKHEDDEINTTKKRIQTEIAQVARPCNFEWITGCKEIENYIPKSTLVDWAQHYHPKANFATQCNKHQDFFNYLKRSGVATNYSRAKPRLALELSRYFVKSELEKMHDLGNQMERMIASIRYWNGL